ncbi:nucleotidyltransferase [Candidatus Saccharibacteria bacterium CPR2]|nr:nucleotidyltransferase [Candidatus Saccharibacteria bacterium CPR2]
MDNDTYLRSVITAQAPSSIALVTAIQTLSPVIREWANGYLLEIKPSGSFAKGTAVRLSTDVDLFISLSPSLNASEWPLARVYQNLYDYLRERGYQVTKQNVSIGVNLNGIKVDLVPGRKQGSATTDHSIYSRKQNTWKKTNIDRHISHINGSNRHDEIRLLKIWRHRHRLEFPSFPLEIFTINALSGHNRYTTANNMIVVLDSLQNTIHTTQLIDPGNASNNVANELTQDEKRLIANKAAECLRAGSWNQIIW